MSFHSYAPSGLLAEFVDALWSMTNNDTTSPAVTRRVCPDGAMQLVIRLAGPSMTFFHGGAWHSVRAPLLAGPFSKSFLVDQSEFSAVLGVRFKPGAARFFFPVPPYELHNVDVPLADLSPREAANLQDELLSASSLPAQFRVLECYLHSKLSVAAGALNPAVAYALREFLRQPCTRAISDVVCETGLSHTRFIQVFRESVGLTPKLFCRVQRFRTVLERVETGRPINWAQFAADCGYFDQAHLIHDFKTFSGTIPTAYPDDPEASRKNAAQGVTGS